MRLALLLIPACLLACSGESTVGPPIEGDASADMSVADGATAPDSAPEARPDVPDAADAKLAGASLRIVVISDLNGAYGSTSYESTVHAAMKSIVDDAKPDLVLVTGDMIAGQKAGLDYGAMWAAFHDAVTDPLAAAAIPIAITPGNHDASGYSGFSAERAEFVSQWSARKPKVSFVDDARWPLRYSFAHKGAFFLSLDATTVGPLSAEQRAWVDAELAAAKDYKIKIAYGHVPIHPVAEGRETEVTNDLALEKIFADRGLTLFLSGHHHGYYPGVAGGVRQVATSCLGAGPRALIGTATATKKTYLLIDVVDDEVTAVDALVSPTFDAKVPRASLPAKLSYGAHTLTRDDLAGF